MLQLLLYIIAYLIVMYAIILLVKKNRHSTDILLAIWLILLSTVYSSLNYRWEMSSAFAHCVFLYFYVKHTITKSKFRLKDSLHFTPFLLSIILFFLFPETTSKYFILIMSVLTLYILVYFTAAIRLVIAYKKTNKTSIGPSPDLAWLILVITITILGHFIKIIPIIFGYINQREVNMTIVNIVILALLNVLAIKAVRLELNFFKKREKNKSETYATYNLKESEINLLKEKLLSLMEDKKLYLSPDLTLKDLSEQLDSPSHYLSFLLNTKFNQNFYEFINTYRLEEVKKELLNPRNKHLSIYAIASDCGFNSQSTFNRFFRQKTGFTPSQYREKNIICS